MTAASIDLGGTNLRWAVVDGAGKVQYHRRLPRPREAEAIVVAIRTAITECRDHSPDLVGVGISVAGIITERGITSTNLDWHEFPLVVALAQGDLPVVVINDMAAGALGELDFGRARGLSNVIYLTISTGVGAGIIVDGEVYRGANGMAGEVGHMVVDLNGLLCSCGRRGCWEMIASGTAHHRRIREAYASGTWPNLNHEPTPAEVTERAREGDRAARALVMRTARYVGIGVSNLANLYDPQAVIFTGGFARNNWDLIRDYLKNEVREQSFSQNVQLLLTALGDDAGILGAASLVFRQREKAAACGGGS
ncbi:MAG: ROK family protein [Armatimonadetes bacterium]|nr:ROK family protein [Armatimonadota bacterium]